MDEATDEGFFARFLAQLAAPNTQQLTDPDGNTVHLVDVTTGSSVTLTPDSAPGGTSGGPSEGRGWRVRQAGPLRLWEGLVSSLRVLNLLGRSARPVMRNSPVDSSTWQPR
ncbi:hypothetical protein [Actinomadura litoris]|uniref:hypothetical protein n=1 Tax=Actinomadura litoris TaxID=2678616 RepID=UPI001C12BD4D|nr:hypothetical protein [Actinomadura litoris]